MSLLRGRRPDPAGRQALAAYRNGSRAARLHTRIRWWSAPFSAIEQALPRSGRILEIGCGHGLFCTYTALTGPDRVVHGVDIDTAQIAQAHLATAGLHGRLSFAAAPPGVLPPGPWDAVVIIDVLYLLAEDQQRRLLTDALTTIAPGGVLLVKEMAPDPAWKARWNTIQETLAVKLLRITEGGSFTFLPPDRLGGWLRGQGATVQQRRLDTGRIHPHHLLVATVPALQPPPPG